MARTGAATAAPRRAGRAPPAAPREREWTLHAGMRDAPDDRGTIDDPRPSIRSLQAALRAVAVLPAREVVAAGVFDKNTTAAVRRFQWYLGNIPGYLAPETGYHPRQKTPTEITGAANAALLRELARYVRFRCQATGDLVKVYFSRMTHMAPNSGFSALIYGDRNIGLCDRSFAPVLAGIGDTASAHDLYVFVNQLFRVEGAGVSGAVVTPAGFSAHKLGRAVDLQLGTQARIGRGNPQLSTAIKSAKPDTPFGMFRDEVKTAGSRYGGDFNPSDPPHFDRQVMPAGSAVWKSVFFFNQLQYRQALSLATAIPDYVAAE